MRILGVLGIVFMALLLLYGCVCFPGMEDPYDYDPCWFPNNPPQSSSAEFFVGTFSGVLFGAVVGSMFTKAGRRRR